jgi:transcriptional regulator with XRE-family HTH domain
MLKKVIGNNIRYLRKQKGFTQRDAAFRAGFTAAYWGYLERGEKNPSAEIIEKIADTLNVSPYLLLVDSTEKYLPADLIRLLYVINDMGKEHTNFFLAVMEAYIKTNKKIEELSPKGR